MGPCAYGVSLETLRGHIEFEQALRADQGLEPPCSYLLNIAFVAYSEKNLPKCGGFFVWWLKGEKVKPHAGVLVGLGRTHYLW